MIGITTFLVLAFVLGLFYYFYKTENRHDSSSDVYLWVGHGEDPFKK